MGAPVGHGGQPIDEHPVLGPLLTQTPPHTFWPAEQELTEPPCEGPPDEPPLGLPPVTGGAPPVTGGAPALAPPELEPPLVGPTPPLAGTPPFDGSPPFDEMPPVANPPVPKPPAPRPRSRAHPPSMSGIVVPPVAPGSMDWLVAQAEPARAK